MPIQKAITNTQQETEDLAINLARSLNGHETLALYGNLGMGKSVFARALIRALTQDTTLEVPSPTFTLVQTYDCAKTQISHFDCYRLEDPEEIYEIGYEDALADGICIIEWPERIESLLPVPRLDIIFKAIENNPKQREITIEKIEE